MGVNRTKQQMGMMIKTYQQELEALREKYEIALNMLNPMEIQRIQDTMDERNHHRKMVAEVKASNKRNKENL